MRREAWEVPRRVPPVAFKDDFMAQVKDPVCGMMIDDSRAAATSDHEGERYYFCSQECKTKFDDNPKRYTGRA